MYTHTLNNKHHMKPKPRSPPIAEVQRDNGDKQTHGAPRPSTKMSHNFFTVNKSTITFCLQIPLHSVIGLAGSPLSSPSHVPVQRFHPPVPLVPLRPLTTGHHRSFHPTVTKASCPLASFHSCLTSATADESTSSHTVLTLGSQGISFS